MTHSPPLARSAALAALAALALPLPAAAQSGGGPIQITACQVLQYQSARPYPRAFWYPFGPGIAGGTPYTDGIRIAYTNRSRKTADRVLFQVNYRGDVERVVDTGTFSPGAPIDHTFGQFSGLAYLGPQPNACRVLAVRFTDGTAYRAGR